MRWVRPWYPDAAARALDAANEVNARVLRRYEQPPRRDAWRGRVSAGGLARSERCCGVQDARELAMEISLASLGSSQTFRSPQLSTEAASLFCNLRATMAARRCATLAKRAKPVR